MIVESERAGKVVMAVVVEIYVALAGFVLPAAGLLSGCVAVEELL